MKRNALPHQVAFATPPLAAQASFLSTPESATALLHWLVEGGK